MMGRREKDGVLRQALRRNVFAATGLLGLLICAAIAASLVTWHVADPSLSNATELNPRNVLGMPGAIISDMMIQAFGLGSAFLLLPPVLWFWRLVRLRPMGASRKKAVAWLFGLALIAIAFSTVPAPDSWPLAMSLGGMIGDGFLSVMTQIDAYFMQGLGGILVGVGASIAGLLLLLNASSLTMRDLIFSRKRASVRIHDEDNAEDTGYYEDEEENWDEEEEDTYAYSEDGEGVLDRSKGTSGKRPSLLSVPLGALSHWALSRKASKRRAQQQRDLKRLAKASRPSLLTRLIGEDDDGLDQLSKRTEPQLDVRPGASFESGPRLHNPTAADMGYGGPQDFAPRRGPAETTPPWDGDESGNDARDGDYDYDYDERDFDPQDVPQRRNAHGAQNTQSTQNARGAQGGHGAQGMAPPELERGSGNAQHRAATNETAQSQAVPAGGKGRGKRMIKGQGNLFNRRDEYQYPPLDILAEPESLGPNAGLTADQLEHNARLLEGVLSDFGIRGEIIKVRPGPVVTLYELEPAPGIKSSRVIGLADDIARSMSAISARVAVVPGRNAIGIELPNARRETVYLREMLASKDFDKSKAKLPICLGKNIAGDPVVVDLARMPHVLVAGTTGSGKSVSINTTILSLLYRHKPEDCRLIMIDPKMLELSIYDGIPHLLTPVVTDPSKAVVALKWAVREMEQRYKNMSKMGVRNIDGFNKRVRDSLARGEDVTRTIQTGFDPETGDPIYEQESLNLEPMPYIVIVVDEMADLMMVAGKDIEGAIQRLAQMARAAGIHLIMATQRPSVDVITGTIKANFPTRMSFQVTSKIDSRTILGEMGAEQLLGMGDMLYMAGGGRIQRVHGAFVADEEVEQIVSHLKMQGTPDYLEAVTEETDSDSGGGSGSDSGGSESSDAETLYDKAVDIVIRDRKASTSYIQRRLSIGYNRAATLIEQMEQDGVISPANHAGKREVLVPEEGSTM